MATDDQTGDTHHDSTQRIRSRQARPARHSKPTHSGPRLSRPGQPVLTRGDLHSSTRNGSATTATAIDAVVRLLADAVADRLLEQLAELTSAASAPALLDRRGLAQSLGVGVDTVDRLRREGMPTLMVGDSPRFELDAVLAWLRERGQS